MQFSRRKLSATPHTAKQDFQFLLKTATQASNLHEFTVLCHGIMMDHIRPCRMGPIFFKIYVIN